MLKDIATKAVGFFYTAKIPPIEKLNHPTPPVIDSTVDEDDVIFLRTEVVKCLMLQAMPKAHGHKADSWADFISKNKAFHSKLKQSGHNSPQDYKNYINLIDIHRHEYVIAAQRELAAYGYLEYELDKVYAKLEAEYINSENAGRFYPYLSQLNKHLPAVKPRNKDLKKASKLRKSDMPPLTKPEIRKAIDAAITTYKYDLKKFVLSLVSDAGTFKSIFIELCKTDDFLNHLYTSSIRDLSREKIEACLIDASHSKIRVPQKLRFIKEFEKKKENLIELAKMEEIKQQQEQQ